MNILPILDLILGMIFIYFLLGLVCNALVEGISAKRETRAVFLKEWLIASFPAIANQFLDHTLINGLSVRGETTSYISSENFVTSLLEIISRYWDKDGKNQEKIGAIMGKESIPDVLSNLKNLPEKFPDYVPLTISDISKMLNDFNDLKNADMSKKNVLPQDFQRVLRIFCAQAIAHNKDEGEQMKHFNASLQKWFDSMMDRIGGNYKRRTMKWTFVLALIMVALLNIDSVSLARYLYSNDQARTRLAQASYVAARDSTYMQPTTCTTDSCQGFQKAADVKAQVGNFIPLGWSVHEEWATFTLQNSLQDYKTSYVIFWITKLSGLLLTVFAVSFGAPFWFDMLVKVSNLRSSIKPMTTEEKAKSQSNILK